MFITILSTLFLASCAQNKEKREEFKEEHNKDFMVNSMGDSAVANSENSSNTQNPTINASTIDSTKNPTNYKSTEPNTQGGGMR